VKGTNLTVKVCRTYRFEAAHCLPLLPAEHKCHRLHGHNYRVEVELSGAELTDGMLVEFGDLDSIVAPLIAQVDHRVLNEVFGLENPTAEEIAFWFRVRIEIGGVNRVRVYENEDSWAEVS